jgi:hypothetical protein
MTNKGDEVRVTNKGDEIMGFPAVPETCHPYLVTPYLVTRDDGVGQIP